MKARPDIDIGPDRGAIIWPASVTHDVAIFVDEDEGPDMNLILIGAFIWAAGAVITHDYVIFVVAALIILGLIMVWPKTDSE
jgi:hypothetical protein